LLGPDHPNTLYVAACLNYALVALGEPEAAPALGQDTLDRCWRILGPDHLTTLVVAKDLTYALVGRLVSEARLDEAERVRTVERARDLGQETWERARRKLGPDHPVTLAAAAALNLAELSRTLVPVAALAPVSGVVLDLELTLALGDTLARSKDTLERSKDALGPTHLTSLIAEATRFSLDRARTGGPHDQDTVARFARLLGPDHPAVRLARGDPV
jgi:hypothetical protein